MAQEQVQHGINHQALQSIIDHTSQALKMNSNMDQNKWLNHQNKTQMSYIHVPKCVQKLGLRVKGNFHEPNLNSKTRSKQTHFII